MNTLRPLTIFAMLLILLAGFAPHAAAQSDPRPTIFAFTSDHTRVTVAELESGGLTATFTWHVAHTGPQDSIRLDTYRGHGWVPILTETPLPPVGSIELPITPPENFGPPTFRLRVVGGDGRVWDERTLVLPYDADDLAALEPAIETFSTPVQSLDAAALAYGTARVAVAWAVRDRPPDTNLVFEQLLTDDRAQNVELPRDSLWIPSAGQGVVAPVAPPAGGTVRLRLRLIDIITAETQAEADLTIPVIGTAMPPTPVDAAPPPPTDAPLMAGDLIVQTDCQAGPEQPSRGWVDSPGIPSPDTRLFVYSANPTGDSSLIIARADGSGQAVIDAPDKALPLGLRPRWSPDSHRIAFTNIRLAPPGGGTIYAVNADGSDLRRIATYTGYFDDLAWSPDGTRLFFTSGEATDGATVTNYRVYVVVADGLSQPELVVEGCGVRP